MAISFIPFGIEFVQDSCSFFFACLLMYLLEFVHDLFVKIAGEDDDNSRRRIESWASTPGEENTSRLVQQRLKRGNDFSFCKSLSSPSKPCRCEGLRHTAAGLREDRLSRILIPHIAYRTDRRWGRLEVIYLTLLLGFGSQLSCIVMDVMY